MVLAAVMAIGMAALAGPARAAGEDVRPCEPPCAEGAVCLNGTCMVPAQPATAAPDPAYPPAYPEHPYPYPPPPGYGYPPPGYAPPGYPPPAYSPPLTTPRTPRKSGFQPVVYAGMHSLSEQGTDVGLRLGAILGGRATEFLSANGEITVDILNFDVPSGVSASGAIFQMTLSPLFHATSASADIAIGPKLGAWALSSHASGSGFSADVEEQGWTLGANLGVFFSVGQGSTALGFLFSYANLQITRTYQSLSGYGKQYSNDVNGDTNIFSLTFTTIL